MRSHFKSVFIASLMVWAAAFSSLHAQTISQWINRTSTTTGWSTNANWLPALVPSAVGDIANITADITVNQIIDLGGPKTVGTLNLGDLSGGNTYQIGTGTTQTLTFNNSTWGGTFNLGGRAELNKVQGGTDTIAANVSLATDLAIYNRVALIISGVISDPGIAAVPTTLLKLGTSNLTLNNANTYTGDTIIYTTGGTVTLNNTASPGAAIQSALIRLGNSSLDGGAQTFLTLGKAEQIANTSVIRFDGGGGREAFFRLNGFIETLEGITDYTSNGVIENVHATTASTLKLLMATTDSFYNGYLRNGGAAALAVEKNGAGTLTLAGGRVSFSGGMTVGEGKLVLSNLGNNVFGSNVSLAASTALEFNATADYVFTKAVTGSGSVSKTGGNTVTLTQNNTLSGVPLTIADGTLRLSGASGGFSAASSINLTSGGGLLISNRAGGSLTGGATTNASATITVANTSNLAVGMSVAGTNIPAGAVVTSIGSATQFNISANATATATGLTFTATGANATNRIADSIPINSLGGGIRFDNGGGAVTYTETLGALNLNGGATTIVAGQTGNLADPTSSALTFSSLTRQGKTVVDFAGTGGGSAALGSGPANQVLFTGGLLLDDGIIGGWATFRNRDWATYGVNGVAELAPAAYNIGAPATWVPTSNVKIESGTTGTVTLAAAVPDFVINSLNIQDAAARTLSLNGRTLVVASGGILSSGADHFIGGTTLGGILKVNTSVGQAPGFDELIINVGDNSARTLTVRSQIADNVGSTTLVKAGPGRLVMIPNATNNTYSGGTTVLGGTIEIKQLANLGTNTSSNFLVLDGGGVELASTAGTLNLTKSGTMQITLGPNGGRFELDDAPVEILNLGNDVANGLPVTGPGRLTLGGGDATGGILNANGPLSFTGGLTVATGTLRLNHSGNTFSGGITMSGGILELPVTGSLPNGLDLSMTAGTFRIYDGGPGGGVTLSSLSGTGGIIDTLTTSLNPPVDLPTTLTIDQKTNTTFAGKINDVFGDTSEKSRLSLIKTGTGILTLSGVNSGYRGTTTIGGGALAVTRLAKYGDFNSSIGSGDYTLVGNSADGLIMAAGTSLIYVGTTPSSTDRSFTIGTGSEAGAIYANGTVVGASVSFLGLASEPVKFDTANVGATLTLGGRNTGANTLSLALEDNGTGYLSLVKTGPGTWILDNFLNANTYSGSTTIYEGRLVVGDGTGAGDGALGSKGPSGPPVQLLGGVLELRNVIYTASAGNTENLLLAGGRLDTSVGTSSWAGKVDIIANLAPNVNVGRDAQLTLAGAVGGVGALDKDNFGTLVLSGVNTFAGSTRIRDGTLVLDYTTTPGDNKLADAAVLAFGGGRTGGTLTILGSGATETVGSTTLDRGQHEILRGDAGNAMINLKTITRNAGALLDVEEAGLAKTTNANNVLNSSGILGAWATVGHTSWARKDNDGVAGIEGFIVPVTNFIVDIWQTTSPNNTDAQNSISQTNKTTNTLRFNQASTPVTITLSGVNTLTSGGILVTPNVGVVDRIIGGTITVGPVATSGNELVVQQFAPNAGFVIGSVIANATAPVAAIGLQKLGPGVLALTGANTYTGVTTIAGGTLLAPLLQNGGLPSSVGQSATFVTLPPSPTAAQIAAAVISSASGLVIGGGTLEYTGESKTVNRGFTVREFGAFNVGNEDMTLAIAGDATDVTGSIVGDSGTAIWAKTGAGTLQLVRLEASGGASGIQTLDVSDGKLILENRYSTVPTDTSGPTAVDRLINTSANLTVSGGKLEFIGDNYVFNNGASFQRFFSQFTVGTGGSEIQVTSQKSLNPLLLQQTTLGIGNNTLAQEILRDVGGTVLFVENPNGGQVVLNLYTVGEDQGVVLPWATYWNKSNIAQPGVNNFAAIEQTDQTVVSADSKSLYSTKSNPNNWFNDGLENISEEGGSPFSGTVAIGSEIATLRFFNDNGAGTLTLAAPPPLKQSLTLTKGAILIGANVKNNQKTITGGTITSTYLPADGQAELIIHNYNPLQAFNLVSQIVNPTSLVTVPKLNLVITGTGTTALFAANTYTGTTLVTGGVLKLENANALPGGIAFTAVPPTPSSGLTIDGGQIGLTSASGNFTRALGTGINQVQWTSSGGFAAYGVDRSVNLGGNVTPSQVIWGVNGFVPSGDTLILSAADADKTITFQNSIELGVTDRLVRVENGTAVEDAVLSGAMSGAGALIKNGEGTLRLTATNLHLGGVTLAEGTLIVPAPSALGPGPLNVGTNGNTFANDAPTLVLESGTIPNTLTVGNKNSAGITSIEIPNDVTLNGAVTLNKTGVFTGPDSGKVLTITGAVGGTGGLTLVDGGTIKLNTANTYGSGAGAAGTAIDGSTIIRNGTIELRSSTALGDGTRAIELGDAMFTPVSVDRATTGVSITLFQGSFDPVGNGVPGSLNGIGAFYDVSNQLDGTTYTAADGNINPALAKKILVKDQIENPEQNGVYYIRSVNVAAGTMNITRLDDGTGFPLTSAAIAYGTDVSVLNGTVNTGKNFFLGKTVDAVDINVDGSYWKNEVNLNPNVALLVGTTLASPITNPIDVNDTNGTGTTTIGFTPDVIRGTATLSGAVTLQSQIAGVEIKDLFLTAEGCAELILSGAITDPGAGDLLNLIKTGAGTVTLSGANGYDGFTEVRDGVLKLDNATALGAGNLNIAGGIVGLTTASGNFSRTLGTGAGQVQWSDSGGFAAFGTDRTIDLGAAVAWGTTAGFVATGKNLVFGSEFATNKATLVNNLDLGTAVRTVQVDNGLAAVEGAISGIVTGGAGGSILKTGQGTLLLSNAANSFVNSITVQQGKLQGSVGGVFGAGSLAVNVGNASTLAGDVVSLEFLADPVANVTNTFANNVIVGNNPGTYRIDATNGPLATTDVILSGTVSLAKNVFVGPDAGAKLRLDGVVSGAGSITVVDGGTVILTNANSYGSSGGVAGTPIDGGTIVRSGAVEARNAAALGTTNIELGDVTKLYAAVDRASNGTALSDCGAVFTAGTNTFTNVDTTFDGFTYTTTGARLLIKDELANPERNGIYQITAVSGTSMTLVRVADFDQIAEMGYGSQVPVTSGTSGGTSYFLSASVGVVNTSPVIWQPTVANPNVALLVGTTGLTIANTVDLNATGSTGTTTIGGASTLTTGSATFSGNVKLQSQSAAVESLILDITSSTPTGNGIVVAGVISTADPLDLLQVRKVGTGVAELTAINTYTNGTVLANGTLQGTRTATGVGSVFGTGAINVGTTIATQTGDALKLEFLGDNTGGVTYTVPSANNIIVGNQNATGTTSIDATNGTAAANVSDVDVLGTVSLGRRVFLGPDANATLQLSGAVSGASGGITVVDGGTVRLTNNSNTYGSSLGATGTAIDGGTIIRNGTIEVFAASALGTTTIELGDARNNLIAVDRASNGVSLSDSGAVFASGTFTGVNVGFGGGSYTSGNIGTRLLVKDEVNNSERNGIYEITAVTGSDMTLVRVTDFDATSEMIYGSTVQATNGVVPNQQYFLTGTVGTPNTNAVLWRDTASNPNVALLAASAPLTIANTIDLNASGSTGTTTLGSVSTLTTGSVTFSGTITMQDRAAGAESLTLDVTSALITTTATGVTLSNVISDGAENLQLRKVGAGVATLTGNNTYDGGTLVNSGVLLVNNTAGSGTGTGTLTVSGTGTVLGGTGSISGNTTINSGAILQPGTGISDANAVFDSATESLAFTGGLTLGSGSTAVFRLNGATAVTGYDQVLVTGTLDVNSTAVFQVSLGFTPSGVTIFNLLDWGSITNDGNLADQVSFVDSSPALWDVSNFTSAGTITYIAPEPGRFVLLLLAVSAAILRRRRMQPSAC